MKGLEDEGATFAKLPNHRGALDYYNREQQTFMDLYGDWLWLALFAAGGFSSAGAWLMQILSRRRKQLVENVLDRLLEILGEAREAADVDTLDKLTVEIDGLVTHAIRQARWRASEPMATTADAASAFPITRDNAILRSLSAARCRCVEKNRETQFNWSRRRWNWGREPEVARHRRFGPHDAYSITIAIRPAALLSSRVPTDESAPALQSDLRCWLRPRFPRQFRRPPCRVAALLPA